MDLESPEKNQREMELFKSFDFEPFLQPDRLYILYDLRDDLILSSSKHLDGIRYVPEVLSNTRVAALRTEVTTADVEKYQYQFLSKSRDLKRLTLEEITETTKTNRLQAQFVVLAFEDLQYWIERSRHFFMPAHPLDPLINMQIELELAMNKTPDPMGYCGAYATAHEVSLEEAHVELTLAVSALKQNLQKSQEIFWRFKKKIIDDPPQSITALKNLRLQMKADFILTHRL